MTETSFAARVRARTLRAGPLCRAGAFIERERRMRPDLAAELEAALADQQLTTSAIAAVLADEYADAPSADMLNRHRHGRCLNCPAKGYGA